MRCAFPTILGAALLLAAALPGAVSAKDLGVRGATWPVAEPDLLAQIEARLREMERSGALARLEQEARANARRKLEEPDPVSGIAPAREERSRLFDPAITVARDIRTPDGTLIAAAGTRVNPLERIAAAAPVWTSDCSAPGRRALRRRRGIGRPRRETGSTGRTEWTVSSLKRRRQKLENRRNARRTRSDSKIRSGNASRPSPKNAA